MALTIAGCIWLVVPVASAQEPQTRGPFRPIFGAAPERPGTGQSMNLSGTFSQVFDDNILADQLPEGDPRAQVGGLYPSGTANLSYRKQVRRGWFEALANNDVRFYPQLENQEFTQTHAFLGSLSLPMGRRTTLRGGHSSSYANYYTIVGLPGFSDPLPSAGSVPDQGAIVPQPQPEFSVAPDGGWIHYSNVGVSRRIGRSDSLEFLYGHSFTNLVNVQTTFHELGARYSHEISRGTSVVAGYRLERGHDISTAMPIVFHNIDGGLNLQRRLTRSGSTNLLVSTGAAIIDSDTGQEFRLLADASLSRLIGRTWTTSVAYHRGVEFLQVLGQVLASDSVSGIAGGYLHRALQANFSASYSHGFLGRHEGRMDTLAGIARLRYGLSQTMAIEAQYAIYRHLYGEGVVLPVQFASDMTRQSIQGGFAFWLPVMR